MKLSMRLCKMKLQALVGLMVDGDIERLSQTMTFDNGRTYRVTVTLEKQS